MPLRIQAGDGRHPHGTVGARTARGDHSLVATGHCIRLHAIVPTVVRKVADVVVVPYVFALWLVLPVLAIADNVKATSWTAEMVGWELLGAALDELLPLHEGDAALTPSQEARSLVRGSAARREVRFWGGVEAWSSVNVACGGRTPTSYVAHM